MRAAVVGAGFAGLMWGLVLAEAGLEVSVYEEHDRVGYPPHCTGIVSERTLDLIGAPAKRTVEARYTRVLFEGDEWSLEVPITGAARLDRARLEELMLEKLQSEGARILLGSRVSCACPRGRRVRLEASRGGGSYELVVIAEGYGGKLKERIGVRHNILASFGLNVDYMHSSAPRRGTILISFPPHPGSVFSWALRARDYTVVGALSLEPASLAGSVEWMARQVGAEVPLRRYGGRVIHGPPLPPGLQAPQAVIVGDAAALNKPLTGGGLFPNAVHARRAQELMRRGLQPGEAALRAYRSIYKVLARQHRLARPLIEKRLLADALRLAARLGIRPRAPLDYDLHRHGAMKIARRHPLRVLLLGVLILIRDPPGALGLLKGVMP